MSPSIIINSAGIGTRDTFTMETENSFDKIINVNLKVCSVYTLSALIQLKQCCEKGGRSQGDHNTTAVYRVNNNNIAVSFPC